MPLLLSDFSVFKQRALLLRRVIANSINVPCAKEINDDFVKQTNTQAVEYVPRSVTVAGHEESKVLHLSKFQSSKNGQQSGKIICLRLKQVRLSLRQPEIY